MDFRVVTIARTMGAGGEDLGSRIADSSGYRYVDDEIIDRAAALAHVEPTALATVESRQPLARRVAALLKAGPLEGAKGSLRGANYERLIIDVIRETAAMEFVVIVAHGAGYALRETPGVLRLLVTASIPTRVARVMAAEGWSEDRARTEIDNSDRAREDFLHRFYDVDEELGVHYDMVLNTDHVATEDMAKAIQAML